MEYGIASVYAILKAPVPVEIRLKMAKGNLKFPALPEVVI